jgi:sugar lactone lactonase YvrE
VAGLQDGAGNAARFFEPSGLSATRDALYVADTNNHAIRRVDIASGSVLTLVR